MTAINTRRKKILSHGDLTRVAKLAKVAKSNASLFLNHPERSKLSLASKKRIVEALEKVQADREKKDRAEESLRIKMAKLLKSA